MSNISDTLSNLLQILMPKILGWVCLNFKKLIENKEIRIKREKPGDEYGWSKI